MQLAENANCFFMVSHMGVSQCKMADEPDLLQRVIGPAVDLRGIESGRCDADGLQQRGDLLLRGDRTLQRAQGSSDAEKVLPDNRGVFNASAFCDLLQLPELLQHLGAGPGPFGLLPLLELDAGDKGLSRQFICVTLVWQDFSTRYDTMI